MKRLRLITFLISCLMLLMSFGCVKAFRYSMGCAEIASGQDFSFYILSDVHHMSKSLHDNGKAFDNFLMTGNGKLINYSDEIIDAVLDDVKAEAPDFLILPGDMTCNGEKVSHEEMVKKLEEVESMGTCVFVIPGNHDIQNPWASEFIGEEEKKVETITAEEFADLYSHFGYEEAISRDPDSLSYLAMPTEDTWLLMLDSISFNRNMRSHYPTQGGELRPQTLKWIEQCAGLAEENSARLIAVMHHSLLDHSELINEDYTISNSEDAQELFKKYGIEIVLTGHIHIQDIKTKQEGDKRLYDIATSSLLVYPHQYGKMTYTAGTGFDYNTVMVDMKSWADKRGITDKVFQDFKAYSTEVFIKECCKRHNDCLSAICELDVEERKKVLGMLEKMNLMYFAGFRNEAFGDIVSAEGLSLLKKIPACFTKAYAMSMLEDERADNNFIHIPVKAAGK